MKKVLFVLMCVSLVSLAQAGTITSQLAAPTPGAEDVAQLLSCTQDPENIAGTGITSSAGNDWATYVANDRTSQGQTFTMDAPGLVGGVWVKHVGWDTYLSNGTWSGLNDGTSIDIRISSLSGTTLTVLGTETATVAVGSGIPCSGTSGTDMWLYIDLDTPIDLTVAGLYAFDLTSYSPWFELDGLEAGPYAGGSAYTTNAKGDVDLSLGTIHADGDRSFVVDVIPEPATLVLLGLGSLVLRRKR